MGRSDKKIINNGIDIRDSGYYSTDKFIADYITTELINLNPKGLKVLDPAVGNEELLEKFYKSGKEIDSFDIYEYDKKRYSNFVKQDFIKFYKTKKSVLKDSENINLEYDYYIANPPYNCHEVDYIKNNKKALKLLFGKIGVHNMYSMFLSALVDCAKDGALIGLIISDSFLTSTAHSGLRQQIIDNCSIHQLILCPNNLFWSQKADVRTCIIILQKGKQYQKKIKILNRSNNTEELKEMLSNKTFIEVDLKDLILSDKKSLNQFVIDVDPEIRSLFKYKKIGDLFKCVTGISTGNDKKYLSKEKKEGFEIPFYKNPATRKFITKPDAYIINDFMDESLKVKDFMVRNKSLIFKEGITCSSMGLPFGGCYLPENATFGVNANIFTPKNDLFWVLSYINSHLVTYIVRGIIIRSNMVTSGYISQIPVIPFTDYEKEQLAKISKDVLAEKLQIDKAINRINQIVYESIKLKPEIISKIDDFANNLNRRV